MKKNYTDDHEKALQLVAELQKQNAELKRQLDWFKRQLFGRKSEKLIDLPPDVPCLPGFELKKTTGDPVLATEIVHEHERKQREKNGWNEIPADLPREEIIIPDPKAEAEGLKLIGYETSEKIARREVRFFVKVLKRAKYVDPDNPLRGVVTAPAPADPFGIEGGRTKFDVSFVVGVAVDKIENHLPLYRQSEILAREGLFINRSTLQNLFTRTAEMLVPLYECMKTQIDVCPVVHGDETPVNLLQPGHGKCKKGYMWLKMTAVGPPLVLFHFADSRSQEVAKELYGDYYGTIIRDSYVGYDCLPAAHAGCWAHVRRRFFEADHAGYSGARKFLALIRNLYAIEYEARSRAERKTSKKALYAERRIARKNSSKLVAEFFDSGKDLQSTELPSSPLGKALAYALNQREALEKFLNNPQINIDNNPAENVIRPIALGRKNWLFAGSAEGGQNLAVLASFAATCHHNHVNFSKWLTKVLIELPDTPVSQIANLLPHMCHGED